MEFVLLGWPSDEPTLRLDYRRFSYAGKFVMTNTGKAVVRDANETTDGEFDDDVLAAIAFNEDRTDPSTLWLRYITVRRDRRGEGLGPRLVRFVTDRATDRGFDALKIAVNNPFAYEALYSAGFSFTGDETGLAELVLTRSLDGTASDVDANADSHADADAYRDGLERFRERDTSPAEAAFIERKRASGPPDASA